jgi:hypothetical protein
MDRIQAKRPVIPVALKGDQTRHLPVGRNIAFGETRGDAGAIDCIPVLAHLPQGHYLQPERQKHMGWVARLDYEPEQGHRHAKAPVADTRGE